MIRVTLISISFFIISIVLTSCTDVSRGCYSRHDKIKAHENSLPYWEDIIRYFPEVLIESERSIDRVTIPKRDLMFNPPPRTFFDPDGDKIEWEERKAPDEFAGYCVQVEYSSSYPPPRRERPLSITLYYSEPLVDAQKTEIMGERNWKDEWASDEGPTRRAANGFSMYLPDLEVDREVIALFNENMCLVCTIHEDDPYKYQNMFYEFLTMINTNGILEIVEE